ncbi:hypothetical protein EIP86_008449 [Pleurotus ostreatoroseus]|nr:hypothetical protein EIP86_008449 [Pleurotus ostreatoroseus]
MADSTKLPTRQLGGHKAAMKNPNVSEEAKERSAQIVDDLEHDEATHQQRAQYDEHKDETRVNAGFKATLKNPNVSEEAKEHARDILEEKGAL